MASTEYNINVQDRYSYYLLRTFLERDRLAQKIIEQTPVEQRTQHLLLNLYHSANALKTSTIHIQIAKTLVKRALIFGKSQVSKYIPLVAYLKPEQIRENLTEDDQLAIYVHEQWNVQEAAHGPPREPPHPMYAILKNALVDMISVDMGAFLTTLNSTVNESNITNYDDYVPPTRVVFQEPETINNNESPPRFDYVGSPAHSSLSSTSQVSNNNSNMSPRHQFGSTFTAPAYFQQQLSNDSTENNTAAATLSNSYSSDIEMEESPSLPLQQQQQSQQPLLRSSPDEEHRTQSSSAATESEASNAVATSHDLYTENSENEDDDEAESDYEDERNVPRRSRPVVRFADEEDDDEQVVPISSRENLERLIRQTTERLG